MPYRLRSTAGPGDVEIAYRVSAPHPPAGTGRPTLLLIHGWAQSGASWGTPLLESLARDHRVVAVDLRGHGASGVPPRNSGPNAAAGANYSAVDFAGDIAAVIAAESSASTSAFGDPAVGSDGVVLAGWSYGGLVACDHVADLITRADSVGSIRGIVLVGAITSLGRGQAGGRVGSAMRAALPDAYSADPRTAIRALGSFGSALVPADRPDLGALGQQFFGTSLATAPEARSGLFAREASYDQLLRELPMPVLIVHGTDDQVVDVSAARHAESLISDVRAHYWDGAGHAPFVEDPDLFARQVTEFVAALGVRA
ncbi:alpha/beta fold hydrolase [Williamsia phyllosphaerae]|uniref:Alpha/beta hydrolase n=1 Tax=Williamsia phyllosphaerae TaxID=885042 RepID=A0ABQ1UQ50_9NOCA|nr:alpha/beta hydrolase [Williamsia phyllosphaerae]GGF22137.1 alpha/beta hydrolase [Williamsia phyllosphaerae]